MHTLLQKTPFHTPILRCFSGPADPLPWSMDPGVEPLPGKIVRPACYCNTYKQQHLVPEQDSCRTRVFAR